MWGGDVDDVVCGWAKWLCCESDVVVSDDEMGYDGYVEVLAHYCECGEAAAEDAVNSDSAVSEAKYSVDAAA